MNSPDNFGYANKKVNEQVEIFKLDNLEVNSINILLNEIKKQVKNYSQLIAYIPFWSTAISFCTYVADSLDQCLEDIYFDYLANICRNAKNYQPFDDQDEVIAKMEIICQIINTAKLRYYKSTDKSGIFFSLNQFIQEVTLANDKIYQSELNKLLISVDLCLLKLTNIIAKISNNFENQNYFNLEIKLKEFFFFLEVIFLSNNVFNLDDYNRLNDFKVFLDKVSADHQLIDISLAVNTQITFNLLYRELLANINELMKFIEINIENKNFK